MFPSHLDLCMFGARNRRPAAGVWSACDEGVTGPGDSSNMAVDRCWAEQRPSSTRRFLHMRIQSRLFKKRIVCRHVWAHFSAWVSALAAAGTRQWWCHCRRPQVEERRLSENKGEWKTPLWHPESVSSRSATRSFTPPETWTLYWTPETPAVISSNIALRWKPVRSKVSVL